MAAGIRLETVETAETDVGAGVGVAARKGLNPKIQRAT